MSFTIATPEGVQNVEAFLAANAYLSGGNSPGGEDADLLTEIENHKFVPNHGTSPHLFGWWWTLCLFREGARNLWRKTNKGKAAKKAGKKEQKKEEKKEEKEEKKEEKEEEKEKKPAKEEEDEDLDDLFDSDEDEEAAAKAREEQKAKAAAAKNKKKKKKKEAKSIVEFDVKGYEVDFDWDALATKIRAEVNQEGLTWMDEHEIVPLAFGMKCLRMKCVIVDDLVSTEDIFEKIAQWEDDVQSVDVFTFNKA